MSSLDALLHFKLAPLSSRRDMANLGIIHRSVLGMGPSQFRQYFVKDLSPAHRYVLRTTRSHSNQLLDPYRALHRDYINRSVLGYIAIYNLLPQWAVASESVHVFQSRLQDILCDRAQAGAESWWLLFSAREALTFHPLRSL